ncbi:MAG: Signal-transduction histidine kinase senX3 [Verrucomicrobia bacterium ADurb.Bin122]|nr:MAG: Signal-transduction histidine kinase senX3 [Verrucomicrobia bacterium ADurb.Bin122]HNW40702.1 HAMP domain-containing sensor histidine kinase [Opitutaceae bacterium]HOD48262.1 HAMP domain-containing sensor histidine kinase [Opitutaceae bacterium]HOG93294.1 HAMP domain-containing sensor histidine kinase [Opitutaceae bacterium]HOY53902.1 HAMP domain-containing sensor histidine kinase [Opitutaceae bacterium]
MHLLRSSSGTIGRTAGAWLTLLLLFVVLVPSACLLWFVNRAAENENLAVRQKLVEAYRAHLLLAQERAQSYWLRLGPDSAAVEHESAPALFARLVRDGVADAVVGFDASGLVLYPNDSRPSAAVVVDRRWREARVCEQTDPRQAATLYASIAADSDSPETTARALQAQARCLVRASEPAAAIELLTGPLAAEKLHDALDPQGRLIAPNAALMALELLPAEAAVRRRDLAQEIADRALDYRDPSMTSAQRRFLLRELSQLAPAVSTSPFLAAEDLAARWLAAPRSTPPEATLCRSSVEDVWQFAPPGGRLVFLHRTDALLARLHTAITQPEIPADVRIDLVPPGAEPKGVLLTLPAGSAMPEWRLALVFLDPGALTAATSARSTFYLWIGGLTVVFVVLLACLTWKLLQRQLALTRLRNDLVANVTHELKTPLASMRLFVETILAAPALDEKTVREYLTLIAQENLRLSRLIDNFLTFSRIERKKYVYDLRPVEASEIAECAAAAVRERFNAPECTFTTDIPADLPAIEADAGALVTALINLLDNAWKYSGDTKRIAFAVRAHGGSVEFAVTDNGIGLAPRDRQRIFRRFYQVRPQGSPANGGCGLGLSIVHSIVDAHCGTICVDSAPGCGSTFTIALPIARP